MRLHDWRISFLPLFFGLLLAHYTFFLFDGQHAQNGFAATIAVAVGVGGLCLLFCLNRFVADHRNQVARSELHNQLMSELLRKMLIRAFKIDENGRFTDFIGAGLNGFDASDNAALCKELNAEYLPQKDHIEQALSGKSVEFESEIALSEGSKRYRNYLIFDSSAEKGAIGIAVDISKDHEAHEATKRLELQNSLLVQNSPHLIFRIRDDGTYISLNHSNNGAHTRKAFIGKRVNDIFPKTCAAAALLEINLAIQEQTPKTFHYDLVRGNQTLSYKANILASGPNEVIAFVHNKTAHQGLERALAESEKRFDSLIENLPFSINEIDEKGRLTSINAAGLTMFGCKQRDEIIGHSLLAMVSLEDKKRVSHLLKNAYDSKPSEFEFVATNGTDQRIFSSCFIPLNSSQNGHIEKVISITQDITERKRSEEQLRKLYHAVEQSPTMVVITDPFGVIEYVNPKFTTITGYESSDILGKNANELGELSIDEYDKIWATLSQGKEWRGEFHNRKKNGEYYWEFASISSIKREDQLITHYVRVSEDITSRKKLEEQLMQSQKMEAIGRLAGGIAHDFNNLLTAISGYSNFLLDELDENDPKKQDIREIQKAGERAALLTHQLLAFSRKQMLQPEMININETVNDLLNLLKRVIGENIALKIDPELNLDPVWADAGQIQQALLNLCINGRDAMPKGGQITIGTENIRTQDVVTRELPLDMTKNYIQLNVRDTGVGMDDATKKQIFEPFYTTKDPSKGTGLGLAVVYGIVKQHSGHIEVESAKGEGTNIKIYIPSDPEAEIGKKVKAKTEKLTNQKQTILVVEDDETVRTVAVRILKGLGYKIKMAQDGSEAVKIFNAEYKGIDLVIMDVVMPKSSGPEAYEKMRLINPDIPVIFVTGYDVKAEIDELQLKSESPVSVLQKPYTKDSLQAKVVHYLDA